MPGQRAHCADRALQASGRETEMTIRHILAVAVVMSATCPRRLIMGRSVGGNAEQ